MKPCQERACDACTDGQHDTCRDRRRRPNTHQDTRIGEVCRPDGTVLFPTVYVHIAGVNTYPWCRCMVAGHPTAAAQLDLFGDAA